MECPTNRSISQLAMQTSYVEKGTGDEKKRVTNDLSKAAGFWSGIKSGRVAVQESNNVSATRKSAKTMEHSKCAQLPRLGVSFVVGAPSACNPRNSIA